MTFNYLKVKGLGSIVLPDERPEPNKDYLLSLIISLSSINKNLEDAENPYYTYICKYISTNELKEIGASKKLKVVMGRTWSQKVKFALGQLAVKKGIDPEIFYEQEQKKRLAEIFNEIDE